MIKFKFYLVFLIFATHSVVGQSDQEPAKPISWNEIPKWRSINSSSIKLSDDGKWMVYAMMPVEGDSEIIIQKTAEPETRKSFFIGSTNFPSIAFSDDSRWFAFKEYPKDAAKKANSKNGGKNLKDKLILMDLNNDFKKTEIENVSTFEFNGKAATHLAVNLVKEGSNGDAKGSDLLLIQLSSGKKQNIGNVMEFAFNKSGDYLVYTIDAANQSGNGAYLLQMASGKTEILESDTATYKSINWTEKGDAFAMLKLVKDKSFKQDHGKVLAVNNLTNPKLTIYDPKKDSVNFPKDYTISPNRKPMWSEDLTRLFYGIHPLVPEKKQSKKEPELTEKTVNKDSLDQSILKK